MKVTNILICMIIMLLSGCKELVRETIVSGDVQLWDQYDPVKGYIVGGYSFSKKGEAFYYTRNKKGERKEMFEGDVVIPRTWELKNDSLLILRGFDRKILSLKGDTMVLLNPIALDTTILLRVKDNIPVSR